MQLINLSSTNKVRVVNINLLENEDGTFTITRLTGQLNGKMTEQPEIYIEKGKVKRTIEEQANLEFNSHCKKYKDKGYVEVDGSVDDYSEEELRAMLPEVAVNSSGGVKPMLAKQEDKIANRKIFEKEWYASRKIDGLRCLIYMGEDGKLHTSSRGAMNYDYAMMEILDNPALIECFNNHPGLIMDGEAYHHGWTLQQLNGVARTQKTAVDFEVLQFYWYDIVDTNKPFVDRLTLMMKIQDELNLQFQPNCEFTDGDLRIQFVPQVRVSGWDNMIKLHNDYVAEGWEGLVIRDPKKPYKPNGRTNDMVKIKQYKDDEFEITGYELGLRGSEDMCFKCVTSEGKEFLAKPWGDRALKEEYVNNFENYLGKMAVVKYFYMSDDNVPLQPSVKCIRLEEDM